MTAVGFCVFCVVCVICVFCVPCLSVFPSSSSFCTNSVCVSLCNTGADPGAAQPQAGTGSQRGGGGGGLGVGARAVPLQLAPLLLRLLRLASARRLAASLFVSTFCSGTPCCLCCANEHGQSGGAAEGALLWQDGQRLCPGTGEKVRRTLLPARPHP